MKTDEQIRAEAESRWLWRDELSVKIFESAAKWALSQDSTIEKVKELRDEYSDFQKITIEYNMQSRQLCEVFVSKLNAIIEAK